MLIAATPSFLRAGVATLYTDSFDAVADGQRPPEPWKGGGELVSVQGGRLSLASKKWNPVLTLDREFEGDVAVAVDLRGAGECHWSGVVFKGVYWITVNRQFGTLSSVKRVPKQPAQTMATCKGYGVYVHNVNAFRLSISQVGNRFLCTIDGKTLLEFEDPQAQQRGSIQLVGGWGTKVYFDNLVVSRPKATPAPVKTVRRSISPTGLQVRGKLERADGIFPDSVPINVTLVWTNSSATALVCRGEYRLVDYWESVQARVPCEVKIPARENREERITLQPKRRGAYKLALHLKDHNGALGWATDPISFAVIPEAVGKRPPREESYFGGHPEQIAADSHLAFARRIGMNWARCHDLIQMTWWKHIEPENDKWVWRDEQLRTLLKHGMFILGEFCKTPAWAARRPAGTRRGQKTGLDTYPPASWDEYREYVYQTVRRFMTGIHHWEVWNEPNHSGFWRGTPEEYAVLLRHTYRAAKLADPDCTIVGVGGVALSQMAWLERSFRADIVPYMDDLSTHGYVDAVTPMSLLETQSRLPAFKKLLRAHGFKGGLWDSEHSIRCTSFIDDFRLDFMEPDAPYHFRVAAENMMKTFVFQVAEGYERVFPYMLKWVPWHDNEQQFRKRPIHQNMIDVYGTPKPMTVAYATTALMMEGAQYAARLELGRYVQFYLFRRGDDTLVCYWGRFGRHRLQTELLLPDPAQLDLDRVQCVDIMANHHAVAPENGRVALPLSPEPVWLWCQGQAQDQTSEWLRKARLRERIEIDFDDLKKAPERQQTKQTSFEGAEEVSPDSWLFVDLRSFVNMGLADDVIGNGKGGWSDEGDMNDMRDLPTGRLVRLGVPFDVIDPAKNRGRSVLTMYSSTKAPSFPDRVEGIPVRAKVRRLFLVHAAAWAGAGSHYSTYVMHYASGRRAALKVIGGVHNHNWWTGPTEKEQCRAFPVTVTNTLDGEPGTRWVRILEWRNLHTDDAITAIDVVSAGNTPIPILVAISGERKR